MARSVPRSADPRKSETPAPVDTPPPLPVQGGRGMFRVDAAHAPGEPHFASQPASTNDDESEASLVDSLRGQLQRHGEELAAWLDARHGELDTRSAALDATSAELEADARTARFWYDEQQELLAERETELALREAAIVAKARALDTRERELLARERGQPERPAQAVALTTGLAIGSRTVDQPPTLPPLLTTSDAWAAQRAEQFRSDALALHRQLLAAIERRRSVLEDEVITARALVAEQGERLTRLARDLADRQRQLEAREEALAAARRKLLADQNALATERERVQIAAQSQRDSLAQHTRHVMHQGRAQQRLLEERAAELAQRDAVLTSRMDELRRTQLDLLQQRLACEELTRQLGGLARPAALEEALARRRAEISDHYRLAETDLARRRRDLEERATQLARAEERLSLARQEAQEWLEERRKAEDGRMKDEG